MRVGAMACVAIALAFASSAQADGAEAMSVGRALSPWPDAVLDRGVERLAQAIIARAGARTPATSARDKLVQALATDVSLAAAYGPQADFVMTRADGLTAAGEALRTWLGRARFHGLDLTPDPAIETFADAPGAETETALVVPPAEVAAAWRASAGGPGGEERLRRAASALVERVPALGRRPASEAPERAETRVAAELALARGLVRLVAELPAQPRTAAVLEDPDEGYYISPDSAWKGAPAPVAVAADLASAWTEARSGDRGQPGSAGPSGGGQLARWLEERLPRHPQYRALVAAAERYATLCATPWPTVLLPKSDKVAKDPAIVKPLRARLAAEGFLAADGAAGDVWDDTLDAALTAYRERRQLKARALIDKELVESLNVPCAERLRTLTHNVARWRHSAWAPTPTWVQVNLAAQELRFFENDALVMRQRTVVGSNKSFFNERLQRRMYRNATPILADHIARVIINPEWNVPPRIARDEIDPEVEKDPDYLTKKGFRTVIAGNGAKYYVQAPGPGNALGQIKILFPNDESVYLHDTPGKAAFKQPMRALSHGCVRVQNAMDFGLAILRHDAASAGRPFDEATIRGYTFRSMSTPIELTQQIPVFLEYYTASVDEDGQVWFHPDIYGYDAEAFEPAKNAVKP